MREILFRGKLINNDKWVEGNYVDSTIGIYIFDRYEIEHYQEIVPETVGQYTGLKDKNGTRIFEGDIVKYGKAVRRVIFEQRNNTAYFGMVDNELETIPFGNYVNVRKTEVIGNIYDNPELLKGGADNA